MESNINDKDYQSINIEIPKWLQEISRQITDNTDDNNDGKIVDIQKSVSEPHSAKYGRRSSDKNQTTFIKLYPDRKQYDLEQSWRSLDKFKQSHKGRLDSANKPRRNSENIGNLLTLSSTTTIDDRENRSKSELSNYKQVYYNDSLFEKRLNEYRLKIDKENQLRQQIINELLLTSSSSSSPSSDNDSNITNNDNYQYKQYNSSNNSDNDLFIIPELPYGKCLIIEILSTWGDKYYVGLNGIEIFDIDGRIVDVEKITAIPPDINILPECRNDPRIVKNLLDGINRTQDDMHIWLTPFINSCNNNNIITIEFKQITIISMIRLWNYNKSRIHSYRGVRDVVIYLDKQPIFKGEIAKACGGILGGIDAFGDTILFTTDDEILEKIYKNDISFMLLKSKPSSPDDNQDRRPSTSTRLSNTRPVTGPIILNNNSPSEQILYGANRLDLILLTNWGHTTMIGLTGIEIIESIDKRIQLNHNNIRCNQHLGNLTIVRLINNRNLTNKQEDMWWTPYQQSDENNLCISIIFDNFKYISAIRIWNYNGNLETSMAGVRTMKILLDEKPIINPLIGNDLFILRRAPGNCHYDYVQDIKLNIENYQIPPLSLPSITTTLPQGFVVQIIIYTNWGDRYYCGLNGIELYDHQGKKIHLNEQNICAYPESVNCLDNVQNDIRTPDKLIDGINNDHNGSHSWLSPIIPKLLNRIYIVMDQPIVVSLIKLWNYSKTPNRGIKEFGILFDDLLVYNGILAKFSSNSNNYQTVLFTEDENVIGEEYETLISNSASSHDVILLDQDGRAATGGSLPDADPSLRPFTSVNLFNRGYSSHSH